MTLTYRGRMSTDEKEHRMPRALTIRMEDSHHR